MRSVGSELCSLLIVLAVPLGMLAIFPLEAVSFKAAGAAGSVPAASAAFVTLSAEEEQESLRRAKISWKNGDERTRHMWIDLSFGRLPGLDLPPVLSIGERTRAEEFVPLQRGLSPFVPSQAAPRPERIPHDRDDEPSTGFSREELLKLR